MAATPTSPANDVTGRTLDLGAEVRKAYGPKWNEPEVEYTFTGRTFKRRTGDCAVYATSPDHG